MATNLDDWFRGRLREEIAKTDPRAWQLVLRDADGGALAAYPFRLQGDEAWSGGPVEAAGVVEDGVIDLGNGTTIPAGLTLSTPHLYAGDQFHAHFNGPSGDTAFIAGLVRAALRAEAETPKTWRDRPAMF